MNTIQKGNYAELKAMKLIKDEGGVAIRAKRMSMYLAKKKIFISKQIDFFGLFDIIAKFVTGETWYLQIKSDITDVSKAKPAIKDFCIKYGNTMEAYEIWLNEPRKGFRRYYYDIEERCWLKSDFYHKDSLKL